MFTGAIGFCLKKSNFYLGGEWLQILKADFSCPAWFSTSAKKLIKRILDPNPQTVSPVFTFTWDNTMFKYVPFPWFHVSFKLTDKFGSSLQRITISEVIENEWFKKGYQPPSFETVDVNLDDVHDIFNESGVTSLVFHTYWKKLWRNVVSTLNLLFFITQEPGNLVVERREERPSVMNAFELISTSQGLNLGTLFEKPMVTVSLGILCIFFCLVELWWNFNFFFTSQFMIKKHQIHPFL